MNSYFEQSGFYGQAAASAGADPSYRFPLGLAGMGMSPYAQHQPRPQDYDVAAAAAVSAASAGSVTSPKSSGLYSPHNNDSSSVYKSSSTTSSNSTGGSGTGGGAAGPAVPDPSSAAAVDCKDQTNGYSSLSKELNAWGSTTQTSGGVAGHGTSAAAASAAGALAAAAAANGGVRPSVCTPDMTRYTPSTVDAMSARDRWMSSCSLTGSQAQPQQSAHQTFYPWMAIAGK